MNRKYELVYVVSPEASDEQVTDLHTQVEATVQRMNGQIEKTENWGRRKLAYEIARHRDGVYVLEVINGPGVLTTELDRRLRVLDAVIRHIVVRVDGELGVAERARTRRKESMATRRIKRGLPPEPTEGERRRHAEDDDDMDGGMETGFRQDRDRGER